MSRKTTRQETRNRRLSQSAKVYELKVTSNRFSQTTKKHLHKLFLEGKWLYNQILESNNIKNFDTKIHEVQVKTPNGPETRKLSTISSQMKQAIKDRTFMNVLSLHALKLKGKRIGRLKFKSYLHSIPLKQNNVTFSINRKDKTIRIQGLKQKLHIKGLDQIPENCEIANANLINYDNEYYIHVTTYVPKIEVSVPETSIGIDFGCQTQLTLSNGIKIEYQILPSKRLRRLDRKIDKKVNDKIGKYRPSNNRRNLQTQRRKEHRYITNKKKDIRKKIVNAITTNFKYVCFQDENIHAWAAGNHGKKIQFSGIGGIISDLKNKSHTPIMVNKFFPSTQLCPNCGNKHKLSQSERVYVCDCGFIEDRDLKSARCIETEAIRVFNENSNLSNKLVPTEHRDIKPEEHSPSTFFGILNNIQNIRVSKTNAVSQETPWL
jgi:putative transposase